MYVLRTPQAPEAVVCVVSIPRLALTSLQAVSHSAWTLFAAVLSAVKLATQACTVACAAEVAGCRPLQPSEACETSFTALATVLQPAFDAASAVATAASTRPRPPGKRMRLFMARSPFCHGTAEQPRRTSGRGCARNYRGNAAALPPSTVTTQPVVARAVAR
jgi:hypothetical protein